METESRAPVVPVTRDEVEPAVGALGREPQPLGRGRRRNELDAGEARLGLDRQVGDDEARCAGRERVLTEALVAVRLEDGGVGHRDNRDLRADEPARLGEALEAGGGAHTGRERPLAREPDDRPVRERVGEREPELEKIGPCVDGCAGQIGRLRERHQVDREPLARCHSVGTIARHTRADFGDRIGVGEEAGNALSARESRRRSAHDPRTVARSLSPRPDRPTRTSSASRSRARASACAGSSAGMIPSRSARR